MADINVIRPDWQAPAQVKAFSTTRQGGVSQGGFASFNLGNRAGDADAAVAENRRLLSSKFSLPQEPAWLWQVHGTHVADAGSVTSTAEADASIAHTPGVVSVVLTADCLPVLLCDTAGTVVAAAHCGWRGLVAGMLPQTVAEMVKAAKVKIAPSSLMAWLGPAIGPNAFEVGPEVQREFVQRDQEHEAAFVAGKPGKFMADIYRLARRELAACGVTQVAGGVHCTVSEPDLFYSYRRDVECGRMASLIWIEN